MEMTLSFIATIASMIGDSSSFEYCRYRQKIISLQESCVRFLPIKFLHVGFLVMLDLCDTSSPLTQTAAFIPLAVVVQVS